MEKTNCLLDAVKNQLQNAISNIDAGNSNLNEEEMEELVKTLSVLNKGVKRISKAYACEHILHCSPATFDNYVRAGIIPNQINAEMFGIYKSQVDADFGLYKSTRDSFDITNARVGELEKQVAVLIATRPYQDALIQSDIRRVAEHADFNLFRRTCRMITGELVLPNTPTVTGYPSYNPCRVDNSTSTPAA